MRRTIVVVHSGFDRDVAMRMFRRLRKEEHNDVHRLELRPDEVAALPRRVPGGVQVFVILLSHGLLADTQSWPLVEFLLGGFDGHWLTVIKDRDLERGIPSLLGHIHAITPRGDMIASIAAELARLCPPQARPPRPATPVTPLVAPLVALVALSMLAGLWAALGRPWGGPLGVARTLFVADRDEPERPRVAAPVEVEPTEPPAEPESPPDASTSAAGEAPSPGEETEAPASTDPHAAPDEAPPATTPTASAAAAVTAGLPHLHEQRFQLRNATAIVMIHLEGGSFLMGDHRSQKPGTRPREAAVAPFWMGQTEVTQAQWASVTGQEPSDLMAGIGDEHPVQNISWEDAVGFLNQLSKEQDLIPCYAREGKDWVWHRHCDGFRLPTEAEWEYAARAGSDGNYPTGTSSSTLCRYGNIADRSAKRVHPTWSATSCDDGFYDLAPVKSFAPNPWKLYDMHGNVWEFVWDRRGPYPETILLGYAGVDEGTYRIKRGGAYSTPPHRARSSGRYSVTPSWRFGEFGLRVARSGSTLGSADPTR